MNFLIVKPMSTGLFPSLICSLLAILLLSATGQAQQINGRILGSVMDSQGAAVPAAQVTVINQDTGATRNTAAGGDGLYNVPQLPAGKYTIEVMAQGFGPAQVKDVEVAVGTDARIDVTLQVGSVQQVVTVSEAVLVETTTSSVGNVVSEQRVAELPLNGRNWSDLTL